MTEAQRKQLEAILLEIKETTDNTDTAQDAIYNMMCSVFRIEEMPF